MNIDHIIYTCLFRHIMHFIYLILEILGSIIYNKMTAIYSRLHNNTKNVLITLEITASLDKTRIIIYERIGQFFKDVHVR